MSEKISGSNLVLDGKIKDISEYLKKNVLDPAEEQKSDLLTKAQEEKKQIIERAHQEAERIIKDAEAQADRAKSNMEASLRIAAKQAVDTLKQTLEKEVLSNSVDKPLKETLAKDELMKEFINEVVDVYLKSDLKTDVEVVLSEKMREKLSAYIKKDVIEKSKEKITLSSDKVPNGFQVVFKDERLMFDFTNEALTQLIAEYLRADLRSYLFENK